MILSLLCWQLVSTGPQEALESVVAGFVPFSQLCNISRLHLKSATCPVTAAAVNIILRRCCLGTSVIQNNVLYHLHGAAFTLHNGCHCS